MKTLNNKNIYTKTTTTGFSLYLVIFNDVSKARVRAFIVR